MNSMRIFISSVQKELAEERMALKAYIEGDALLRRFFKVFLFEDLPASDRRADEAYLDEVERSDIYLGLFGQEYGHEDATGRSPVEREFDRATELGKLRLIYVRGADEAKRHIGMATLVRKAGSQLIRRRFTGIDDLVAKDILERVGETGRGAFYRLRRKGDINGTSGRLPPASAEQASKTTAKHKILKRKEIREEDPSHKTPPVTPPVETLGKTLGKTPALILTLLQEDPYLTVPDIAARISKSGSAVQRSILKLQSAGRLKRTGSRKVGKWEVLK